MLEKDNSCIWTGIGSDIPKESRLHKECAGIQKVLSEKYGSSLNFSNLEPSFHLNLYDLDIPKKNLPEVLLRVKEISSSTKSFKVDIKALNYFPYGLFFIELEGNSALTNLHKAIVNSVSPLKEKCICEDYLQPHREYNSTQKSMLKLFGNPFVLSQFLPHITLGIVRGRELEAVRREIDPALTVKSAEIKNIHIVAEDVGVKRTASDFTLE